MIKRLPKTLMLGTATAATQVEGGDKNSNWYHWSELGMIANQESSIVAADHYNRVEEDINLMVDMHLDTYRMSIEWSRIFPKEGIFSREGMEHYIDELKSLKSKGIVPLISLHHFSAPQWFQEKGGWTNPASVQYFLELVETVVSHIGDLCHDYCTINEPNVFVNDTYMDGKYPPGHKDDMKGYFTASKHLILAHLKAYQLIHDLQDDVRVGFAHHVAVMDLKRKSLLMGLSRKFIDHSFHQIFYKGMVEGKLSFPIGRGYPEGKGIFCDFIGINYYSRHLIEPSKNIGMLFGSIKVDTSKGVDQYNDLGWEIYPEGLGMVIEDAYEKYKLPIYITENGIADYQDRLRGNFIFDHLQVVGKLIDRGIPVERYYHWSLMDNLEWNDGYGPRFGLVEIDYETLERKVRKSGYYYRDICKTRELVPFDEWGMDHE